MLATLAKAPLYIEHTDLLTKDQIDTLNKLDNFTEAEIYDRGDGTNKLDNNIRRCKELILDNETVKWISNEITPKLNTLKNYRFDLCHLGHTRIVEYKEGDFFVKHKDVINLHSNVIKSYSILISLNECGTDYEGGKTILYLGPNETEPYTSTYNDKSGSGVLFSKDLVHEGSVLTSGTKKILFLNYLCYVTDIDPTTESAPIPDSVHDKLRKNKFVVLESVDDSLQNGDIATFNLEIVSYQDKIFINHFELNGNLLYYDNYEIMLSGDCNTSEGCPLIAINSDVYEDNYLKKGSGDNYNGYDDDYNDTVFTQMKLIDDKEVFVADAKNAHAKCIFNPSKPELSRKTFEGMQDISSQNVDHGKDILPDFDIYSRSKIKMNTPPNSEKTQPSDINVYGLQIMLDIIFGNKITKSYRLEEPYYSGKRNYSMVYYNYVIQGVVDLKQYTVDEFKKIFVRGYNCKKSNVGQSWYIEEDDEESTVEGSSVEDCEDGEDGEDSEDSEDSEDGEDGEDSINQSPVI